jgi:hypothetical protein
VAVARDASDGTTLATTAAVSTTTPTPSPVPSGGVLSAESRPFPIVALPSPVASPSAPAISRPVASPKAHAPVAAPKPRIKVTAAPTPRRLATADFHGRNHVWMPALGLDRSVAGYACSNQSYPGNRVYRWGCAGSNNIYLFGHASGVFRSLHDAYVRGALRTGMALFYADGSGTVHRYIVAWWKVTTATKGTWAYAAQSTPSLTLQTCLGAQSQYRLIVRLTRTN